MLYINYAEVVSKLLRENKAEIEKILYEANNFHSQRRHVAFTLIKKVETFLESLPEDVLDDDLLEEVREWLYS